MNIDDYINSPSQIQRELKKLFSAEQKLVIFDIGSCEGEDSIKYSRIFPQAKIYAIEPLPNNLPILQANLEKYGVTNVEVLPIAFSEQVGKASFYVSSDYGNKSSSLLSPDETEKYHPWLKFNEVITVDTNTLENVCRERDITTIDFIHMDVQGAELKVLQGAGSYIKNIKSIWLEVEAVSLYKEQPLKKDIESFMERNNFYKIKDTVNNVSGDQLYVNIEYLQKLKSEELINNKTTQISKHILLYSDDLGMGELAQYNHSLLCGLAALDYRLTCVQSQSLNPMISTQQQLGIEHLWLDFDTTSEPERAISDLSNAEKIFALAQPDLIIFSDTFAFSNSGAKDVAIKQGIPFMVVIGLVDPFRAEGLSSLIINELSRFYRRAIAAIAFAQENLNLLHQKYGLPEDKGQVIYPGIAHQYFAPPAPSVRDRLREELGIPQQAVVCFTCAPLEPVKGYNYQLAAMQRLKDTAVWDSLYFVWAGSGELEQQLRFVLNQLQISEDQVKILGQRWDLPDLLDASDIFVLTSVVEAMPLSIMEAMAKGLPIIATKVSGVPEQLGDTGKLLPDPKIDPHATVNELVATIQAWCAEPQLRHQIGVAAKTRAEQLFTEERMIQQTHALIESAFNIEREVKALMSQALELLNSGNLTEAARIAEQAASFGVNIPEIHFVKAICLSAINNHQQAFEAAKAELEINPSHRPSQDIVDSFTRKIYGQLAKIPRQQFPRINVVIFSKNRACQLELLLRSFKKYFTEWEQAEKTVVYKSDNHALTQGYQLCQKLHPEFHYVSESTTPFKQATLNAINEDNALTMFLVDDIVFKDEFSLLSPEFQQFSKDLEILCISLRLYPKVNYCYTRSRNVSVPQFREDGTWRWVDAEGDWGYPMSLDGNIFSTPIIKFLTENLHFYNPNTFEAVMARNAEYLESTPFMLCYKENSKLLNVPANQVQDTFPTKFGKLFTPEELNQRFLNGERILLEPFLYQQNNAVHVEITYNFEQIK